MITVKMSMCVCDDNTNNDDDVDDGSNENTTATKRNEHQKQFLTVIEILNVQHWLLVAVVIGLINQQIRQAI